MAETDPKFTTSVNNVIKEVLQTVFFSFSSEMELDGTEWFRSSGLQNWQSKFQG